MTVAVALADRIAPSLVLDVAFVVPAQGVTALLGPSGAGKTTVLRAVAGLDRRAGSVSFAGLVWQDADHFVAPYRRRVGLVPQGGGLLPHLTVAANLDYAVRRAPPGQFDRAALVERCGLASLLDRLPAHLSGGEARRAAIVRALVGQPRLLLMDEPLAGLDGVARAALLDVLADVLASADVPVIYVTHDAAEAARLAARVIRLEGGRVVG